MTGVTQADAILEVGAGTGLHSEFIAKSYLKPGALLVSCDISAVMVQKTRARYE